MIGLFVLSTLQGCSWIQVLDSSDWQQKTVYKKSESLPPLTVPPDLAQRDDKRYNN